MNNVHPMFQGLLRHVAPRPEMTEADKARALELAMDPHTEISTEFRIRVIQQYGTAEHIAKFAESLDAAHASAQACT